MAVSLRGRTSSISATVSLPVTANTGDIILAITTRVRGSSNNINTPAGYTSLFSDGVGSTKNSSVGMKAVYKIAAGGETSVSLTLPNTDTGRPSFVYVFSGASIVTVQAASTSSSNGPYSSSSWTTPSAGYVMTLFGIASSSGTPTVSGSTTDYYLRDDWALTLIGEWGDQISGASIGSVSGASNGNYNSAGVSVNMVIETLVPNYYTDLGSNSPVVY